MFNLIHGGRGRASADLAIDFGTANTLIFERGSGIVFNEPSACCFVGDDSRPKLVAAGDEAHRMMDRVSSPHRIARPLRRGVMSDIDAGREMLRYAVRKSVGARAARGANAIIGVPADATQAERRALLTAANEAGLANARLFHEPLMAAIGAGLDIERPRGRMLLDCGAGTTEVVIISLGAICVSKSERIGGDTFNSVLTDHLQARHDFLIGTMTAERIKLEIAGLSTESVSDGQISLGGQDLATGLPGLLTVPASELTALLAKHVMPIVAAVRATLAQTPPELSHDILEDGITLTGGAAMPALLSEAITAATGLATNISERPLDCVALGLGAYLGDAARL